MFSVNKYYIFVLHDHDVINLILLIKYLWSKLIFILVADYILWLYLHPGLVLHTLLKWARFKV
jgi:hypothetical protein